MVPSMTMKKNPNFAQDLMMCTLDQIVPDDHLVRKLEAAIDWNFIYDLVEPSMTMKKNPNFAQDLMMCTLDQIVPDDHLVRKLEAAIDWNFIYDLVEDKYSKTGRPSVDPVVLFKILFLNIILGNNSIRRTCRDIQTDAALRWFLKYSKTGRPSVDPVVLFKILFLNIILGNNSIRRTCRDIQTDAALRWFLGLNFTDPVPNYSDWSQNYIRRYKGTDVCDQIFSHILQECDKQGFLKLGLNFTDPVPNYSDWSQNYIRRYKGTDVCDQIFSHILQECDKQGFLKLDTLFIDSTHQKASANKNKYRDAITEQVKKYLDDELRDEINEIREEDGKKPFETVKKKSSPSMKRPEKK